MQFCLQEYMLDCSSFLYAFGADYTLPDWVQNSDASFRCGISKCELVMERRICRKMQATLSKKRVKCLETEKKWRVSMMRKDVFETKAATLHLHLIRDGGSRQWMIGGRPFEKLPRNIGHQSPGDDAPHPTRTETQLHSHQSQSTHIIPEP